MILKIGEKESSELKICCDIICNMAIITISILIHTLSSTKSINLQIQERATSTDAKLFKNPTKYHHLMLAEYLFNGPFFILSLKT